jgi:hypothetical protein
VTTNRAYMFEMTATLKAWLTGTPWYSACPADIRAVVVLVAALGCQHPGQLLECCALETLPCP